jgi:hypothetical protein
MAQKASKENLPTKHNNGFTTTAWLPVLKETFKVANLVSTIPV